jgi:hypothetical protein
MMHITSHNNAQANNKGFAIKAGKNLFQSVSRAGIARRFPKYCEKVEQSLLPIIECWPAWS